MNRKDPSKGNHEERPLKKNPLLDRTKRIPSTTSQPRTSSNRGSPLQTKRSTTAVTGIETVPSHATRKDPQDYTLSVLQDMTISKPPASSLQVVLAPSRSSSTQLCTMPSVNNREENDFRLAHLESNEVESSLIIPRLQHASAAERQVIAYPVIGIDDIPIQTTYIL